MSVRVIAFATLLLGAAVTGADPTLADETASIDESSLPLEAGQQQVLRGQTTLEQGTELTVRFQLTNTTVPYLSQETVYVGRNGAFAAVFDLSTVEANTGFVVTVQHNGTSLMEYDGRVAPCENGCTDPEPDIAGVPDTVVTVERGRVATIPVSTVDRDSVQFSLGAPSGPPLVNATLTDANDDGEVRLRFDTAADDGDRLSAAAAEDSITVTRKRAALASTVGTGGYHFRIAGGASAVENGLLVVESNRSADFAVGDDGFGFERATYTSTQGEVAEIPVTLGSWDTATLSLGGPANGYQINATVRDGDGDGTVTLLFDTRAAGQSGETLRTVASRDSVTTVPGSEVSRDTHIEDGVYNITLYRGPNVTREVDAAAALSLQSGNVSTTTDAALAVTTERATSGRSTGLLNAGTAAIAVGGLLAIGGVSLVIRTLLS